MKAFQRKTRIETSTAELDVAEMQWWNRHSPLIERIWGLPDEICTETRKGYIEGIRDLFHQHCAGETVRIVELACGSGWPGRLLADDRTLVTGVDFSDEQIGLARTKAEKAGARYCRYLKRDVNDLSPLLQSEEFDGAFIHCGLHHLASDELAKFARSLGQVRKGFVVVLVEPMYHDRTGLARKAFRKIGEGLYKGFQRTALAREKADSDVVRQTEALIVEADSRGWFLSPKEMPFTRAEIGNLFEADFEFLDVRPVSHFALRLGQQLATLGDQKRATKLGHRWLPLFRAIDERLSRVGLLPSLSDDYLFTLVALVRK